MRRIVIALLLIVSLPLHAEVFYSSIINASYLSDFAMSAFPVSFWGEFGVDDLNLVEDLNTRALVRVEAGMDQRTLRQWPSDGSVISDPDDQRRYSVVFSEGLVGFQQGLMDNPEEGKEDFLTFSFLIGVRWEQAFASLRDIQNGDYGGIFDDTGYFRPGSTIVGVPELNGNKYSLSNSISIGLDFSSMDDDYLTPEGYRFSFCFTAGPWWLLNSPTIFNTSSTTDYWKLMYDAAYSHTFFQGFQDDGEMSLYSLFMDFSLSSQIIFGKAVPQHQMEVRFRDEVIPPRPFMTDVRASLSLSGPEFISNGTFPMATLVVENAVAAGHLINSTGRESGAGFYGSIGLRADVFIMGLFRAYAGIYLDYLSPEGYAPGFDYEVGAYFTAAF